MKKILILSLLIGFNVSAVKPDFSTMSETEKQLTGIHKLNKEEQKALIDWLNNKQIEIVKEQKQKKAGFENRNDERDVQSTTLVDYYKDKKGKYYFSLANGQIWKQVEGNKIHLKKSNSKSVTISPKALGAWALQVGSSRLVRVKRVK